LSGWSSRGGCGREVRRRAFFTAFVVFVAFETAAFVAGRFLDFFAIALTILAVCGPGG
jgi:hypothetical protein